jgi:drug/metabolite transporter (DMT)-like permease
LPLTEKIERTPEERAWRKKRAVLMVCGCTVFGAGAQILMKMGAAAQPHGGMLALAIAIFTSATLFAGYSLYGLSTLMLIVALKDGQLSILYPVIALTYVWVTILSVLIFNESVNVLKLAGLSAVVIGVAILGRSGHK